MDQISDHQRAEAKEMQDEKDTQDRLLAQQMASSKVTTRTMRSMIQQTQSPAIANIFALAAKPAPNPSPRQEVPKMALPVLYTHTHTHTHIQTHPNTHTYTHTHTNTHTHARTAHNADTRGPA